MPRIRFEDLLPVYRNTQFDDGEQGSALAVGTAEVVELIARLETDEDAAADSGIVLLDDLGQVAVGANVRVRIDPPRVGLGVLARDLDALIAPPTAKVQEPARYYLVEPPYAFSDAAAPEEIVRYRKVLQLVALFAEAATYLDATRAELVLVKDGRIAVPIRYNADELLHLDARATDRILDQMRDELHRDQKLEILFEALIDLCAGQPPAGRFPFILRNLNDLGDAVRRGYRLFASNFSYSKIRGEMEDARIDFAQKIHATIVDIQSQLLGIPVATVVVASQMKSPTACGAEPWVNLGVLAGAWIFVGLLTVAIINQLLTLGVIKVEIDRQIMKLKHDFPTVSVEFVNPFGSLVNRIWWHRVGLVVVAGVGVVGALLANHTYDRIAAIPVPACTVGAGIATGTTAPRRTSIASPVRPEDRAPAAQRPEVPSVTRTAEDSGSRSPVNRERVK